MSERGKNLFPYGYYANESLALMCAYCRVISNSFPYVLECCFQVEYKIVALNEREHDVHMPKLKKKIHILCWNRKPSTVKKLKMAIILWYDHRSHKNNLHVLNSFLPHTSINAGIGYELEALHNLEFVMAHNPCMHVPRKEKEEDVMCLEDGRQRYGVASNRHRTQMCYLAYVSSSFSHKGRKVVNESHFR
jgi:hypothetical protein